MGQRLSFFIAVFVVCTLFACHENQFNPNSDLTLEAYAPLTVEKYKIAPFRVNEQLGKLARNDRDTMVADRHARSYYLSGRPLLWVSRHGVTNQADTLLRYLKTVDEIGFRQSRFFVSQIESDLAKMKSLSIEDDDISELAARLDYYLTKAYLRYVIGQRFGFMNPAKVFNRLDQDPYDTLHARFRTLYDVRTETIGNKGVNHLLKLVSCDSVPEMLRTAETNNPLYLQLKHRLQNTTGIERIKVMVNMERCRWRQGLYPYECKKYVAVNIPSYGLLAVDGNEVIRMKTVCGSRKTKTPLLNSAVMRMDVNPKWVIPFNIVKHEMAHHAGDVGYFQRHNYVITDKSTGEHVSPEYVSYEAMKSGNYRVVQQGGEGNALGRIVFRFENNFSIYLHDTSSRATFDKVDRSASHGCIRVEKPYELACFLLSDKDEDVMDKLKYSMGVQTRVPDGEDESDAVKVDKSRLIRSLAVKPQVPIFITYFTEWLMPDGRLESYADVYGYDEVIARHLKEYMKL